MKPLSKLFLIILCIAFFAVPLQHIKASVNNTLSFYFIKQDTIRSAEQIWVDSVFNTLSLDEKIAQLIMIRALSNRDLTYENELSATIKKYNIGGLCFFQGGPVRQAQLTNRLQSEAKTPLLISIDGEWGLSMRLDSTIAFPRQMTLGAIQNDRLIYEMGAEIGRQCRRIGIHINFAPVIDINSNAKNPVINTRSFGECKYNVTRKGNAYMQGMQDNMVMAVGKHFPGHGDTDTDSHYTLPLIKHSKERLDTLELYPFKELINKGLMGIMIAHLNIPAYFTTKDMPSTLSDTVVSILLKEQLGFQGLIITDALEMKGVSNYFKAGTIELSALKAGNDILLLPQSIAKAIEEIKRAIEDGEITEDLINERCKKVLTYKFKLGLNAIKPIEIKNIIEDLNNTQSEILKKELIKEAITLVKNEGAIPYTVKPEGKTASLAIGDGKNKHFQKCLSDMIGQTNFVLNKDFSQAEADKMAATLASFDNIFISIHNTNSLPQKNFGITQQSINLINRIKKDKKIVLCIFANPYALSFFSNADSIEALFVSYQDDDITQEATALIIGGKAEARGKLPVTGSALFPVNTGIMTALYKNIQYESPSNLGIKEKYLEKIDALAISGINKGAYPGCQVLLAINGKVFYHKSFGYHTYDSIIPVTNNDIYDLASVTKIMATALAIMKLYDEDKIDINEKLSTYLPYLEGTDKAHIKIIDILGHQARFKAWIPFYNKTLVKGNLISDIYQKTYSENYPFKVADSIFIHKNHYDTIIKQIVESPLNANSDYVYSDLGLYFLREIIEKQSGKRIDNFVYDNFYKPMGLFSTVYNPKDFFNPDIIVPSEVDKSFRKQIVRGYVNDQGVAMTGGLGAHAGLFSNTWELAVLLQMLLNEGRMHEAQYLNAATVQMFTSRHFTSNKNNRRALLFDKPFLNPDGTGPTCKGVSQKSYGHSGFTGTYVWVDPEYKLIYIFLSNRTFPLADNPRLTKMGIRTEIHQTIYDAINNK